MDLKFIGSVPYNGIVKTTPRREEKPRMDKLTTSGQYCWNLFTGRILIKDGEGERKPNRSFEVCGLGAGLHNISGYLKPKDCQNSIVSLRFYNRYALTVFLEYNVNVLIWIADLILKM